ncbi:hypothetical protein [Taibaiella soli]|uniref:DUF4328 domain-containing protein n=1 Tax=Taibaiella soli TaxID=1649169 RepID=A0A2W2BB73_9BACT|nr:hypothetical protein [Taibaiella soli]PZF70886.1 hypothetical protein DN068_20895 [Taibaiella soli]
MDPIGALILGLIVLGGLLTVTVLFILTLSKTLQLVDIRNRTLEPNQVWLILIPIFNFYWSFVLAKKISASISNEFRSRAIVIAPRPTYALGIATSVLDIVCSIMSWTTRDSPFNSFLLLASFVVWIAYWANVADYKKKLSQLPPKENEESLIFKNIPVQH